MIDDMMSFTDKPIFPTYAFFVDQRPSWGSARGKAAYQAAIAAEARMHVSSPIVSDDVEVDILFSSELPEKLLDVDNAAKATLDAMTGVVFLDDRQVRALHVLRFDRSKPLHVSGRLAPLRAILARVVDHSVWVNVYSRSRADELGPDAVEALRKKHFLRASTMTVQPRSKSK